MERIAAGYHLAEAPVALPDGSLVFSDVLGGGVHRWDAGTGEVSVVHEGRKGIGGMALHADGGFVVSGRDVGHLTPDGDLRVLFADDTAGGFNDLTVDPDGHVIVGVLRFRPFAGEPPSPGEFLRLGADGSTTVVIDGVDWPNGCAFSPAGDVFYACDYHLGVVHAVERRPDGTYGDATELVRSPSGDVDGLAVDESGALWVALGQGGAVGRFRPDGTPDDRVEVEAGFVSSVCFGGDGRDLFVTTAGSAQEPTSGGVFRTRVSTAGIPVPLATT